MVWQKQWASFTNLVLNNMDFLYIGISSILTCDAWKVVQSRDVCRSQVDLVFVWKSQVISRVDHLHCSTLHLTPYKTTGNKHHTSVNWALILIVVIVTVLCSELRCGGPRGVPRTFRPSGTHPGGRPSYGQTFHVRNDREMTELPCCSFPCSDRETRQMHIERDRYT